LILAGQAIAGVGLPTLVNVTAWLLAPFRSEAAAPTVAVLERTVPPAASQPTVPTIVMRTIAPAETVGIRTTRPPPEPSQVPASDEHDLKVTEGGSRSATRTGCAASGPLLSTVI